MVGIMVKVVLHIPMEWYMKESFLKVNFMEWGFYNILMEYLNLIKERKI